MHYSVLHFDLFNGLKQCHSIIWQRLPPPPPLIPLQCALIAPSARDQITSSPISPSKTSSAKESEVFV